MLITAENKAILKRLCKILKPDIKKIVAILICIIMSSVITSLLPFIGMKITDEGIVARKFNVVVLYSLVTLGLVIIEKAIGLIETKYYAYINSTFPYTLSKMAFKHTLKLKMSYFNNTNFAEIMNNISMDVGNISKICDRSMFFIISQIFRIFGGIIGLLIIDWRLTVLVVAIVPLRYFLIKYLAKKRIEFLHEYMEQNREYSAWYGDTIGGVREIKLWGIDRIKLGQFIKKQRKIIKINIQLVFMDKINEYSETILFQIITSALYILGAYMLMQNTMTLGGIFTFITYSYFVTEPISSILNIGYHFSNITPSAKRFFEFLDMETEELPNSEKTRVLKSSRVECFIKFENVNFSYMQGKPVLKDMSFEIG
ncbi:MAG: transporter, ATP-binding protein, partial [Clostridiaceae bacterium]|nr:transporter, ATP-binding protein [Clostridiaceae bacterium]